MRSFQNAAVNSMAQSSPGFSGFMSNMMNPETSQGPPPPMATQGPNAIPIPLSRPGNNNFARRPDSNMGRSNFVDDGINIRENSDRVDLSRQFRPEMKGPSDISDIDLSYDTTDAVEDFTVTWTYDYFENGFTADGDTAITALAKG